VSIAPSELTLFAGETHSFAAMVTGTEDRNVIWAVDEENGGSITNLGLYTAPHIQGVYHVTATSKANPQKKAVATVTVLTYCDPPPQPPR
jgi:chitinase